MTQQWWDRSSMATRPPTELKLKKLVTWSTEKNLTLNVKKIKEIIVDPKEDPSTLTIKGEEVERVSCFKFLGTYITAQANFIVLGFFFVFFW